MKPTPGQPRKFVIYKVLGVWQVLAPAGTVPSAKHFRSHASAVAAIRYWN